MISTADERPAVADVGRYRRAGRTIGVLLLAQIVAGPIVNFALLGPAFAAPGFLVNAVAHSTQVSIAALLGLLLGALSLGVAIAAFPILRQSSHVPALWLLALATASFTLTAVESSTVLSLLSLSQAYAAADVANDGLFQTLRTVVGSARNWMHYVGLIVTGSTIFVLYGALFRLALVPRVLAAFGAGSALLQLVAVTMPLFGHRIVFPMLLPLGLSHLALAGWLLTRGFGARGKVAASIAV
jgi:hypothetical protein